MPPMRFLHDFFYHLSRYFMAKMTCFRSQFSALRRKLILFGRNWISELEIGKCSCFVLITNKIIKKGATCAFWASIQD